MLILSECSNNLKIKSRHIIKTMAKIRKTRKILRGGKTDILNKLGSIAIQSGENVMNMGINAVSKTLGVDPNKDVGQALAGVNNQISAYANALGSEQGKQLLGNLEKIGLESIDTLKPVAEKAADEVIQLTGKELKQAEKLGWDLAEDIPVVGEGVAIIKTGKDVIDSGIKVVDTGAQMTGLGADALENMKRDVDKATSAFGDLKDLVSNASSNVENSISSGLDNVQNSLDQDALKQEGITKTISEPAKISTSSMPLVQKGGREAALRAYSSKHEFLDGTISHDKIMKMYGGARFTKKRRGMKRRKSVKRYYRR